MVQDKDANHHFFSNFILEAGIDVALRYEIGGVILSGRTLHNDFQRITEKVDQESKKIRHRENKNYGIWKTSKSSKDQHKRQKTGTIREKKCRPED